jgi:hypothetical protein
MLVQTAFVAKMWWSRLEDFERDADGASAERLRAMKEWASEREALAALHDSGCRWGLNPPVSSSDLAM